MKLTAVKVLCLVLFIEMLSSTQALATSCEHIWTVGCKNCIAPMLMSCNVVGTFCTRFPDGTFKCLEDENITGHIKNNTVIKTVHILFYIIDNNEQAQKVFWTVENFELLPSHTEEGLIESLKNTVLANTPAIRIIDWEITYQLDIKKNTLYKDTNAESAVIPNWQETIFQRPEVDEGRVYEEHEITSYDEPDVLISKPPQIDPAQANINSTQVDLKPSRKMDEIENVKKFLTGNDESHCWHISTPRIVYFTGSDQKICVIESKCINHGLVNNKVVDGEILACAYNNETKSCPSATQCLKDFEASIRKWSYSQHSSSFSKLPKPQLLSPQVDFKRLK